MEPPASVAILNIAERTATEAPLPQLEPPAKRSKSQGFGVGGCPGPRANHALRASYQDSPRLAQAINNGCVEARRFAPQTRSVRLSRSVPRDDGILYSKGNPVKRSAPRSRVGLVSGSHGLFVLRSCVSVDLG